MPTHSHSPRHLRGAIISIDPATHLPTSVVFQYNPSTLARSLEVQHGEGGGTEALKLYGAPKETIKLDAEIDATDALEWGDANAEANGLHSQLAALELLVYPTSASVIAKTALLASGAMEVVPPQGPLILFVWGPKRVLPVQITELSIVEEAYDTMLNPIRARVSLGLQVLSYNSLPASHAGHSLFLAHQVAKEVLAKGALLGTFAGLSLGR
jgi:hypothetical protein